MAIEKNWKGICALLIGVLLLATIGQAFVQDDAADDAGESAREVPSKFATVDATLDALYAGISFGPGGECDWEGLREIFMEGAILVQPTRKGEARTVIDLEAFFADFREFMALPEIQESGFSERIAHRVTDRFGEVAHSYVTFEARLDPTSAAPVARGVDSVQLILSGERWWVVSITTQPERQGLVIPEQFLSGK